MGLVSNENAFTHRAHRGSHKKELYATVLIVQAALSTTIAQTPNSSHLCIRDVNTSQSNATYDTISLFSLLSSLRSVCYILTLNINILLGHLSRDRGGGGNELTSCQACEECNQHVAL